MRAESRAAAAGAGWEEPEEPGFSGGAVIRSQEKRAVKCSGASAPERVGQAGADGAGKGAAAWAGFVRLSVLG